MEEIRRYLGADNVGKSLKKDQLNHVNKESAQYICDILNSLLFIDKSACFEEDLIVQTKHADYIEEKIIAKLGQVQSEAVLLKPIRTLPPYPVVVVFHDHGGLYYYGKERLYLEVPQSSFIAEYRSKYYSSRAWVLELVKEGFAVFCPDAFYFGSRKLPTDLIKMLADEQTYEQLISFDEDSDEYIKAFNKISSQLEPLMFKNINLYGTNWPSILINEDIAWLNYLMQRKDIDKDRIGCMGFSLGGFRTLFTCALTKTIKVSIVVAFMCEMKTMLGRTANHTFMVHIPHLTQYLDLPEIAYLISPRKLFVAQCEEDSLFTIEGMKRSVEKIAHFYEQSGGGDNFIYKFYKNPHQFNLKMQVDTIGFIFKNL